MGQSVASNAPNGNRQRQDSLTDQLRSVVRKANEMGCYDAADWIVERFEASDA